MERRLLIAFVLSALIFAVWSVLFPPPTPPARDPSVAPQDAPARADEDATPDGGETVSVEANEPEPEEPEPDDGDAPEAVAGELDRCATLSNNVMSVEVCNRNGVLQEIILTGYEGDDGRELDLIQSVPDDLQVLPLQLVTAGTAEDRLYRLTKSGDQVTLEWSDGLGAAVTKTVRMPDEGYALDVTVKTSGELRSAEVSLGTGMRDLGRVERNSRLSLWGEVVMLADGEVSRFKRRKVKKAEELTPTSVAWVGFDDSYFLQVFEPATRIESLRIEPVTYLEEEVPAGEEAEELKALRLLVEPRDGELEARLLGAPKEYSLLQELGGGLERTLDFGLFGPISVLFLKIMWWIQAKVGNWGVSIILLTVGIRLLLFPLMHTSTVSMRRMQKVQPKVKEIQAKYKKKKGDPQARQRMNQEMMALYKEEGVNPMAGCLPLLVQLPILWALYKLFLHAIELRHAPFVLWITDLSAKDPYYITPILMTATMWLQQRLAPQAGDPQQQRIMRLMPLIFGIMFLQFPAGLVLYWLTNNVLTIVQQEITLRLVGERGKRG